jgi:uncharacterized protein (UPF0332 family)
VPFDPEDFIELARELYEEGNRLGSEAKLRSSVSRAYYGAFLLICEAIKRERSAARLSIRHERLAIDLKNCPDSEVQEFGQRLDGLRSARVEADYDMRSRPSSMQVGMAVNEAQWLAGRLVSLGASRVEPHYVG